MSLLMIGCGKMGGSLLTRWATSTNHTITIINPSLVKAPQNVIVRQAIEELADQRFDIIVIAIKPQLIEKILPSYRRHLADSGCIISIAAGYSVSSIEQLIGEQAIVRVMPNLPAKIGRGVSGLFANSRCSAAQIENAVALTNAVGFTHITTSEDELDRVTAVAGSGPGYAFEIARCWIESAIKLGFSPQTARELVLNTLSGSMELALTSKEDAETLRNSVTSKNGTTAAGLSALMQDEQLASLFDSTVLSAYQRAVALR
ncbi:MULTISPECIES: pyrroline-5-carboxylate reductase [unclassified Colwellia]|uniref:pyrroline-5-carboxylate reductase n=1 Tax=unclassified Colwellia TaxID=196834 RepID=UPI0015F5A806|nr:MULTISPECIES: pyrroline-5-carboxylate reductase [unclassified Colwellia]MBA6348192.1 pyrroline-5-carboxylate reductase [Colwellia sp. BRX8-9]MBA6354608.1 pyrroline-5-carboxylate reductase [Colwellia sp. BRX8-3]MBA6358979.1 pyrroline-5-carboxylate reductase [Colwellia sp. BRX8-6]MBA6366605.1 pyrroline-5-carboxylate reductase [Colwellia sp. BRX8-5]MBA6375014.1 pyrroline-5-carboxylate reductase [Colwellia sp. BRX8-2]